MVAQTGPRAFDRFSLEQSPTICEGSAANFAGISALRTGWVCARPSRRRGKLDFISFIVGRLQPLSRPRNCSLASAQTSDSLPHWLECTCDVEIPCGRLFEASLA